MTATAPGRLPRDDRLWRLPISRRTALALLAALAIATLPYWEVVLGHRSAMYGDVNDQNVPMFVAAWRAIGAGHWPWWTPGVFAGHSMVGAGQYAVFYPVNVLFGLASPVTAYRWWILFHIWVATAGAFALSYHLFRTRVGAVISAAAYASSGFAVLHLLHPPFVIAAAWLPLAIYGIDRVRRRWTIGRALVAAVPLAFIAFGGHAEAPWMAFIGVGVYGVTCVVLERSDLRSIGRVAGALALALGLSAIQLLPQWEFSRTSQRPSLSMPAAFELSLRPHGLLTLAFPWLYGGSTQGSVFSAPWRGGDPQHEVGMFAGVTILTLAGVAVIRLRRNSAVVALAILGSVSVLIALGGSTPLGRVLYDFLPLARSFRAWARTMLLLNLALAVLAGAGAREVMRTPRQLLPGIAAAAGALAVAALAIPHVEALHQFLVGGPYGLIARGLPVALLLGLLAVVVVMVVYPRVGALALVGICSLEVISFAYAAEWRGQSGPIKDLNAFYDESRPPPFGRPYKAAGGVDRWVTDTYGFRMVSLAKNLRGVNGYDPLIQKAWSQTAGGIAYDGEPTRADFWQPGWLSDVLRVSTLVLDNKVVPTDPTWRRVSAVPGYDMSRWERDPRLPEAYLVGTVTVAPLATIRRALIDPSRDLKTIAYLEHDDRSVGNLHDPGPAGSVESADVLGSGRVVVDAERPSLLVLSHDSEAGWHATVDGRSTPVMRTNGLVLGIPVPAGHHVVRVNFQPPGLTAGALVSFLAVVALLGSGAIGRHRLSSHSPPGPDLRAGP